MKVEFVCNYLCIKIESKRWVLFRLQLQAITNSAFLLEFRRNGLCLQLQLKFGAQASSIPNDSAMMKTK